MDIIRFDFLELYAAHNIIQNHSWHLALRNINYEILNIEILNINHYCF